MYHVYFYKLRFFNNQDISFLQDTAKILSIAIPDLKFLCDEEEITIQLEQNCISYGTVHQKIMVTKKKYSRYF